MINGTPKDYRCPSCSAAPGSPWKRQSGHTIPFGDFHAKRRDLAWQMGSSAAKQSRAPRPDGPDGREVILRPGVQLRHRESFEAPVPHRSFDVYLDSELVGRLYVFPSGACLFDKEGYISKDLSTKRATLRECVVGCLRSLCPGFKTLQEALF